MPRIELAHWMGKHKPGDIIDVADDDVAPLVRDGRVARVVSDEPSADATSPAADVTPAPTEQPPAPRRRAGRSDDT